MGQSWASPGDKVRFLDKNGYETDRVKARQFFKESDELVVEGVMISDWSSAYKFQGIPESFNTVMFEAVSVPEQSPIGLQEQLPAGLQELMDRVDALSADLESAVETAFKRGARDWTAENYPELYKRFNEAQPANLAPGLYRVYWKSGGQSLCAIGVCSNGENWIAPTNWVSTSTMSKLGEWAEIKRLEKIEIEP